MLNKYIETIQHYVKTELRNFLLVKVFLLKFYDNFQISHIFFKTENGSLAAIAHNCNLKQSNCLVRVKSSDFIHRYNQPENIIIRSVSTLGIYETAVQQGIRCLLSVSKLKISKLYPPYTHLSVVFVPFGSGCIHGLTR